MLKLKEGFVLRKIAGDTVVIPSGDELNLNLMITLNETGEFLWKRLEKGTTLEELTKALLQEYDVDNETAQNHIKNFLEKLHENDFLI